MCSNFQLMEIFHHYIRTQPYFTDSAFRLETSQDEKDYNDRHQQLKITTNKNFMGMPRGMTRYCRNEYKCNRNDALHR